MSDLLVSSFQVVVVQVDVVPRPGPALLLPARNLSQPS